MGPQGEYIAQLMAYTAIGRPFMIVFGQYYQEMASALT